jgi:hypothetical protein
MRSLANGCSLNKMPESSGVFVLFGSFSGTAGNSGKYGEAGGMAAGESLS